MSRNRVVLLVLVLVLAASSFGFIKSPSAGLVIHEIDGPITQPSHKCPTSYKMVQVVKLVKFEGKDRPVRGIRCLEPQEIVNNDTAFIQDNLATVKVSPELAGVLALFEQPAGTVVTNISQLYTGTIPPYYEVTIVNGNIVKSVYINARNGNILPPQYNHPTLPPEYFDLWPKIKICHIGDPC
jgi:hypothetical protein